MSRQELTPDQIARWVAVESQNHAQIRERLKREYLRRVQPDRRCGVYILLKLGDPVYVGQACNIGARIGQHMKEGKDFDSYFVVECDRVDLLRLERQVITVLQPPLNMVGGERYMGEILPVDRLVLQSRRARQWTRKKAASA